MTYLKKHVVTISLIYDNKFNIPLMSTNWIDAMHWFNILKNDGTKKPSKLTVWSIKQMRKINVYVFIVDNVSFFLFLRG